MNTFDIGEDPSKEVQEALSLAEQIDELAGELPEEGEEFGLSVSEKAADIARNTEAHNRVTDKQMDALQNMRFRVWSVGLITDSNAIEKD